MDSCLSLRFGQGGNAARYCETGWSEPEDAETWCLGRRSTMLLPPPRSAVPHVLVLDVRPHVHDGRLPSQRLRVCVGDIAVGSFVLPDRAIRACIIPAEALAAGEPIELVFETPDAARPSDFGGDNDSRALSVAVSSLRLFHDRLVLRQSPPPPSPPQSGLSASMDADPAAFAARIPVSQLMLRFESLGQNCEFGLAQRRCGAEPLGLLRFASTPLPNLLAALEAGFAGMGTPEAVEVEMSSNDREFMIRDRCYGLMYHAWVMAGEMTAEALHSREVRRVPLLVRKLLEELQLGEKVFVFKGMTAVAEDVVFPLAALLRRYGPNTLLFLTLADAQHRAGTVEQRSPGFLVGYLERFAPAEDAHDLLLDQWVAVCRAALRLALTPPPSRGPSLARSA